MACATSTVAVLPPPIVGRARPAVTASTGSGEDTSARGDLSALALKAREGDDDACTLLVQECTRGLFNFVFRIMGHAADAEDVVQETFVKAFQALPRYDPSRPWLPWLFTIARRTAWNHLRGRRPTEELPAVLPAGNTAAPDDTAVTRDDQASLWQLARRLNPRYHEVLWLHYGEGFPLPEVAAVMGTNRFSVKVLLHRARRALLAEWRRRPAPRLPATSPPSPP